MLAPLIDIALVSFWLTHSVIPKTLCHWNRG